MSGVQRQVLRGMVWAISGYTVLQLFLWHTRPQGNRPLVSFAFEAILLTGLAAQYIGLRRLSIRQSGILFISWLSVLDLLIWTTTGPEMSSAIALNCTLLAALFFINKRAGGIVLGGFGLYVVLHAVLVDQGFLPAYPAFNGHPVTLVALLRTGLYAFGVQAVGYMIFALIHRALFQALRQMGEERRRRDLAEAARRKAEETMIAHHHLEALGTLASGVAHDVNNALTAVLGNAELLRQSLPPGEQQAFAQDILQAAQSAARTTRQLLSLNRRAVSQPVETDAVTVAADVIRLVGRLMPDQIRLQLDGRSRRPILVDPADLQQALLNLLLNARDALPAGGVITLRTFDRPGGGLSVSVSDNGQGLSPEVMPRIFEPFFTTKPVGKGTGLGLAMVRTFMEEAGGKVTARNLPEGGACFELEFPAGAGAAGPAERKVRPAVPGQRILLLEEDTDLRHLLERVLRHGGHEVTALARAADARERLRAGEAYALLCSNLPADPGELVTLIREFRATDPDAPVLLCTGHSDPVFHAGGPMARSGVELIRKPFTGTELLARLQFLLTASRPSAKP